MDARRALLGRLVDHAPLFPPASLPIREALDEHRRARSSAHAWILARFVCPASRLGELGDEMLALSVVVDAPVPDDPRVEALEARSLDGLRNEAYVEGVPLEDVEARGLGAKIRCGGERVPPVEELAQFVRACRDRRLVFKATAGLHHAYPTEAGEHGFLNLLAACVFGDEEDALTESEGAFQLDDRSFRWGEREAGPERLAEIRQTLLHSIGSCSFFEPVEELERLGILS